MEELPSKPNQITFPKFLRGPILSGIRAIVRNGGHYHAFSLITQGIELLGACLDEHPFHQQGKSAQRFRGAIQQLFPAVYQPFNKKGDPFDLYTNLRCGLLHVVLPQNNLELIQRAELHRFPEGHLGFGHQRGNKRLILVSEEFFVDFEQAGREVIRRIEEGELAQEKLRKMGRCGFWCNEKALCSGAYAPFLLLITNAFNPGTVKSEIFRCSIR